MTSDKLTFVTVLAPKSTKFDLSNPLASKSLIASPKERQPSELTICMESVRDQL